MRLFNRAFSLTAQAAATLALLTKEVAAQASEHKDDGYADRLGIVLGVGAGVGALCCLAWICIEPCRGVVQTVRDRCSRSSRTPDVENGYVPLAGLGM